MKSTNQAIFKFLLWKAENEFLDKIFVYNLQSVKIIKFIKFHKFDKPIK
jgi:hypothetical protein